MNSEIVTIKKVDFSSIEPIWIHRLWPQRKSKILQASPIAYLGSYDPSLLESKVTFWAAYSNHSVVGVISGFKTDDQHYRSRGLFIFEEMRGFGISKKLFLQCEKQALSEGCQFLWSLPRQSAFPAYSSYGFVKTSQWISDKYEFGPNCFVKKDVSDKIDLSL